MSELRTIGIHPKVQAATAASATIGVILAVFTWVRDNPNVIPGPAWFQGLVMLVVPPLLTFLAGYAAPAGKTLAAPTD